MSSENKQSWGTVICVLIVAPLIVTVVGGVMVEWLKPGMWGGREPESPPPQGSLSPRSPEKEMSSPSTTQETKNEKAILKLHKKFNNSSRNMIPVSFEVRINGVNKEVIGILDLDSEAQIKSDDFIVSFEASDDGINKLELVCSYTRFMPFERKVLSSRTYSFVAKKGSVSKADVILNFSEPPSGEVVFE
jgi:hypothetical protein